MAKYLPEQKFCILADWKGHCCRSRGSTTQSAREWYSNCCGLLVANKYDVILDYLNDNRDIPKVQLKIEIEYI